MRIRISQMNITDPYMKAINKYKHHPSILLTNSKLSSPELFSFNKISNSDREQEVKVLNIKKVSIFKNMKLEV